MIELKCKKCEFTVIKSVCFGEYPEKETEIFKCPSCKSISEISLIDKTKLSQSPTDGLVEDKSITIPLDWIFTMNGKALQNNLNYKLGCGV